MVRLKDIAQQAGVSVMTVSKVLRDAPDISVETKGRIRLLAQQMGYVPDSMAQSLRTRKTKLLGLVIPAMTNPIFVRIWMAVEERAFEAGYQVIVAHSFNKPEREESAIRQLLSRRVDGLLISPLYRLDPAVSIYRELHQRAVPVVILDHPAPFCAQFACVETDDVEASMGITRHLIGLGHKHIAFFTGPAAAPWAQERLEGYRRALREAQLAMDDRLVFAAGGTIEEGAQAAEQFLREKPPVTAIQAVNDMVAMGAGNHLLNQGLRIPFDLSLTGFGNFLASEYFRVPLTTARQPKYRLGCLAVETLLGLINGQRVEPQRLTAELIVRASTAAPLTAAASCSL